MKHPTGAKAECSILFPGVLVTPHQGRRPRAKQSMPLARPESSPLEGILKRTIITLIRHGRMDAGPDVSQGTRTPTRRLRLSAILESAPGKFHPNQPCAHPSTRAIVGVSLSKG